MTPRTFDASGMHVRYEKAGQILDALPVPWNADAVIVEANVKLPAQSDKREFTLKLTSGAAATPEVILQPKRGPARIFFRFGAPARTGEAELFWRERSLGKAELPIIAQADFLRGLKLRLAELHAGIKGGHSAPCQAIVAGQIQTLSASAVIESTGALAPLADLDLHLAVAGPDQAATVPIAFTSGQMRQREALVNALVPRLRRLGEYTLAWRIGTLDLHVHRLRILAKKRFLKSLRITATRFLMEKEKSGMTVARWLPQENGKPMLAGIRRVAPCFYVCSGETGAAGLACLTLRAVFTDGGDKILASGEILVTDGPTPFLPVTLPATELARVKHVTLETGLGPLGNLPLAAAPSADLTAEGGFTGADEFLWSAAAEEQLNMRLGKLLEGG